MKDYFTKVFRHLEWADARVLQSLRSAHSVLKKDLDLYAHILGAEHVWLSRVNGIAPKVAVWPSFTLDECERLGAENAASYQKLALELTTETRQRPITYRNSAGDEFTSTLEDILTHVSMHGAYHRGQIAASLRAAGDTPIPTDYIAFVRGAPAAKRRD